MVNKRNFIRVHFDLLDVPVLCVACVSEEGAPCCFVILFLPACTCVIAAARSRLSKFLFTAHMNTVIIYMLIVVI